MAKFILYSAGAFEWRPEGIFDSLDELKKECVETYGFPKEIYESEEEFQEWLDGTERKYEKVK